MERSNQVEQEKHWSLAQRGQNLVHARDGQLAEAADLVEFLVVDRDPSASRFRRDDHQPARVRRGRVLGQTCRQVLVQGGVDFLGQNLVDPMGPGSDGRAAFRDRIFEKHQGTRTKIRLGFGKMSAKSQRTSPSCSIARGLQPGP